VAEMQRENDEKMKQRFQRNSQLLNSIKDKKSFEIPPNSHPSVSTLLEFIKKLLKPGDLLEFSEGMWFNENIITVFF
jgi:hypothetical protein